MQGFPTVIVLGRDGVELDRQVGFDGDAEAFVSRLDDWSKNKNTIFSYLKTWAKDTTDAEWNYRIAMRYIDRYQADLAQRFLRNVLKHDPEDKAGYAAEARYYMALHEARSNGNTADLEKLLQTETDPERLRSGYFALARAYEARKDVSNSVAVYKAALQKLPHDATLMNAAAWFVYEQKASEHYDWAIGLAQKAVQLEPQSASIWDTLAWLLHASGQYEKAVEAMSQCVKLDPENKYFSQSLEKMKSDINKVN